MMGVMICRSALSSPGTAGLMSMPVFRGEKAPMLSILQRIAQFRADHKITILAPASKETLRGGGNPRCSNLQLAEAVSEAATRRRSVTAVGDALKASRANALGVLEDRGDRRTRFAHRH